MKTHILSEHSHSKETNFFNTSSQRTQSQVRRATGMNGYSLGLDGLTTVKSPFNIHHMDLNQETA
jgi:hypothetical protein